MLRVAQLLRDYSSEALREAIGAPMPPLEHASYQQWLATVRTQLGEEIFTAVCA
jgi:hypothetical protein